MRIALVLFFCVLSLPSRSLIVLGHGPGIVEAAPVIQFYIERAQAMDAPIPTQKAIDQNQVVQSINALLSLEYPLTTSLQRVTSLDDFRLVHVAQPLPRPICMVGADVFSAAWLDRYAELLKANNVTCLVISAESQDALRNISSTNAISLLPVNADYITNLHRSLSHYPVVMVGSQFDWRSDAGGAYER